MLEAHLVQETEIQEPGSRGRPAVGLVVETEAGTTCRCGLAAGKYSSRCATSAASWWWKTGWNSRLMQSNHFSMPF